MNEYSDAEAATCVFKMAGRYWLGCDPAEIAQVQNGGGFWAGPQPLDADEALHLLEGREPPAL